MTTVLGMAKQRRSPGRPRDEALDDRILVTTRQVLSESGYEGLTVAAVADRAGTSRPAIYRRWPDKESLAIAAIASFGLATAPTPTGSHFDDLVAELTSFRDGIRAVGGLSLVAAVLSDGTDAAVKQVYRREVVEPRRARIRSILQAGVDDGSISATKDALDLAAAACTGSWYGLALADIAPKKDWPLRCASMVWRGLGGAVD